MSIVEFIRLEVRGNPPEVLPPGRHRIDIAHARFLRYAKKVLEGYYEPNSFQLKPGFRVQCGRSSVPEGIRFLDDDGAEVSRYTLYDLYNDRQSAEGF
jgi:hypothetical protein